MEINLRKKGVLSPKSDYPTAGWLNQKHDLLQGTGLEKINLGEKPSNYATDIVSFSLQINSVFLGAAGQISPDEITR